MGSFSIWHWLIVLVIIVLLFGAGKLPKVAGDLAQGIKNFRKGMKEEPEAEKAASPKDPATIQGQATPSASAPATEKTAQH
jgi:sec-independent protein translocase protein TatA